MSNKQITSLGIPTSPSDATTKQYVDDKVNIKQDKLTAGENIKIDEETNTISATGGSADLTDYYKKEETNKLLDDKMDKEHFKYAFSINTIGTEILNLETTDKTIAGAINELNKKQPHIPQWKEVGTKVNINHIKYTFKSNTKYKIYYNFESQSSIKKFAFICKEFLYGELNTDIQTLDWDKVNDRIMVSLQMQNDTIAIVSDPTRYGQLLKLEELQE
ncbi:MAG: hypothetical protein PPFGHCPK_01277 [Spiroplasma endosymbiont of Drosophila atripex]|nr:MAG: hypothetical protein PPFGHCPK_00312 [Spiroplasma endosymbiont of Drosophila atripex]WDA54807.1 MAG: hypothetical protein PPFGHCPK_01277 [Spiroplasma endosymbiont of Drosophila atripex]